MVSKEVNTILGNQRPEGYWVNPYNMYIPKYKATTHQLLILAELGAKRTPSIKRSLEYMFNFQRSSGHFLPDMPKTQKGRDSTVYDGCCFDGNILYYMIHFGYLSDPRVQNLIKFLIETNDQNESGWACRSYPINPDMVSPVNCYMGSVKVLKAFSLIPPTHKSPEIKAVIRSEVEKVLENEIYRYRRDIDGERKDKAGWKRFGFPLFYQSDALEVLDTLTRLGVKDERMRKAVKLVLGSQRVDGTWLLQDSFAGKMWIDIEEKNKPSKWITLRALRVLKRYLD
jgi:hypothetical protein